MVARGETITITYPLTVTDNQNAATSQNLVIVLTGSNETPVISEGNDTAFLTETDTTLSTTGTMSVSDLDWSDTVAITVDSVSFSGTFVGSGATIPSELTSNSNQALKDMLTFAASGSSASEAINALTAQPGIGSTFTWTFTSGSSGNKAFDFLKVGESLTLNYIVAATDNSPERTGKESKTGTSTVSITITGTNDTPY